MPECFDDTTVLGALNRSIMTATHLEPKHAGAVAAARALAAKIDAWDTIVQWAIEDAHESEARGARPAVPANDNVSLPSFLKYLDALQLVPPAERAKPGPTSTASPAQQALNEMRKGLSIVS